VSTAAAAAAETEAGRDAEQSIIILSSGYARNSAAAKDDVKPSPSNGRQVTGTRQC